MRTKRGPFPLTLIRSMVRSDRRKTSAASRPVRSVMAISIAMQSRCLVEVAPNSLASPREPAGSHPALLIAPREPKTSTVLLALPRVAVPVCVRGLFLPRGGRLCADTNTQHPRDEAGAHDSGRQVYALHEEVFAPSSPNTNMLPVLREREQSHAQSRWQRRVSDVDGGASKIGSSCVCLLPSPSCSDLIEMIRPTLKGCAHCPPRQPCGRSHD